jgi:hypothetical protein
MGDEINVGYVVKRGERTQDELYDLIEKVEDLKLQKQGEGAELSFFVSLSDRVQAVQNLRENELKGYVPSLYYQSLLCIISYSSKL